MNGYMVFNQAVAITGFFIGVFGLAITRSSPFLERWTRRFFTAFFGAVFVYVLFNIAGLFASGRAGQGWRGVHGLSLFGESLLAGMMMILITVFLLYSGGEKAWERNACFKVNLGLCILYIALLVYTQFSGTLYLIDGDNLYRRGPAYPLLLVPPLLAMLNNLILFFRIRERLSGNERKAFLVYLAVPSLGILIQMLFYGIHMIVLGVTAALLCMFLFILRDQEEKTLQREQENARLKVDILLAQIQPHFLYNALLVIREVCLEDPEAAAEAIGDFTKYLRHNMESLESDRPVPFREELEHVREYLRLQQMRFGDALEVEYALECEDFSLPTLTLQPLVENAVKYGVRKTENGRGRVTVRTRETPEAYEVTVSDDGPGIGEAEDREGREDREGPHIGLRNVSERLHRLSGGSLKIHSEAGRGTTVTLTVPKEAPYDDFCAGR